MQRIHRLADEVRETFDDRGWKIEKAVKLDPAFGNTRRPQSALSRSLVLDEIAAATSRLGLGFEILSGGACDVTDIADGVDRRYRVLKAEIDPDTGEYDVICTSDSIFVVTNSEPDALFPAERWVFGYTVDQVGMIVDIFAARVLGKTEESVPRLRLGPVTLLGSGIPTNPPTGRGFQPADEDDLGEDFGLEGGLGETTAG